ncbi:MAG: hypothetical protein WDW36_000333 [Sanguina aurantia]
MQHSIQERRVAVVGSGISGISAAWLLHRNGAKVTVFESEAVCGGHTLTDTTSPYPVDIGFQVYNLTTYPNLVGFLDALGVDTEPSDMSFALSMDQGKLEWGSGNLDTVFAQRKNLASPTFLLMIRDVMRFGKEAPKVLDPLNAHLYSSMTLGRYLKQERYSQGFIRNYVVPMCAAVWSVPNARVLGFPVQMLVRFWVNHHLLDLSQRPLWRVVKGRSRAYVEKVLLELPDVRTSTPVASVVRGGGGVTITTAAGHVERFDDVVFATHSDVTRALLGDDAAEEEAAMLESIPYSDNDVYLHTDEALMPLNKKVWSSWNFLGSSDDTDTSAVCVSYWVNKLQRMPASAPQMFVTLNPPQPPEAGKTIRRLTLSHPVFSFKSGEAQEAVSKMQGRRNTYFAGAWCGFGFHEDGIKSAVEVVKCMGGTIPWVPRSTSPKVSLSQSFFQSLFHTFASATIKTGSLRMILPNGTELHYGSESTVAAPVVKGEEWRGRPALKATLRVYSMEFFRKMVIRHDTGMGEAYMDQDYEADDLAAFLAIITANACNFEAQRSKLGVLNWVGSKLLLLAHLGRPNTIEGSRKNIEEHYDAGNAMYKLFLDESMTYSSGVHREGDSLYQAQLNKIDALLAKAEVKPTDHVLEIGCGWGGFAIRAASTIGCRVTGLTVSKEQLAEAHARVKAAGLEDKINLIFCDYRDCPGAGTYDKVVSVEMIEAVGHEHLVPYFAVIGRMLRPGGRAVIQAISEPDDKYAAYCNSSDFIREHIFPGGHLPCLGAMIEAARGTGLSIHDTTDIGPDYAVTLREWRRRWEVRKDEVLALGYSDRFWRKYRFYFVYCEAAFDARYIHNYHILWVKDSAESALAPTGAAGCSTGSSSSSAAGLAAGVRQVIALEVPTDPITLMLLGLYFFLTGMMVRSQPILWLLPLVSCLSALVAGLTNAASQAILPFYRTLSSERQAWWCADVVHLLYSASVSLAALAYALQTPASLRLSSPPTDTALPSVIVAASAGFYAFHLWVCVRNRLFARTAWAIAQYTLGVVLFGVAAYKSEAVAFLSITLVTEVASVPYLVGKLQDLAGCQPDSNLRQATRQAEYTGLLALRLLPFLCVNVLVAASPAAFSSSLYYAMCLVGISFANVMNVRWVRALRAAKRSSLLHMPKVKAA